VKKKVLSLDVKLNRDSLIRTNCGSEFQTDGDENWKGLYIPTYTSFSIDGVHDVKTPR